MGCSKCKKPKNVDAKPLDTSFLDQYWFPSKQEASLAYSELTSVLGVQEDKKEFISKVYKAAFEEDFNWACKSCASKQVRKFGNWLNALS